MMNVALIIAGIFGLAFLFTIIITIYNYIVKKGKPLHQMSSSNSNFKLDQGEEMKRGEKKKPSE